MKLYVERWRCLRDVTLELDGFNVVQGVGRSTLYQAWEALWVRTAERRDMPWGEGLEPQRLVRLGGRLEVAYYDPAEIGGTWHWWGEKPGDQAAQLDARGYIPRWDGRPLLRETLTALLRLYLPISSTDVLEEARSSLSDPCMDLLVGLGEPSGEEIRGDRDKMRAWLVGRLRERSGELSDRVAMLEGEVTPHDVELVKMSNAMLENRLSTSQFMLDTARNQVDAAHHWVLEAERAARDVTALEAGADQLSSDLELAYATLSGEQVARAEASDAIMKLEREQRRRLAIEEGARDEIDDLTEELADLRVVLRWLESSEVRCRGAAEVSGLLSEIANHTDVLLGMPVHPDSKGHFIYDGRPILECSASEQWLVYTAVQAACLRLTGFPYLVLDVTVPLSEDATERLVKWCHGLCRKSFDGVLFLAPPTMSERFAHTRAIELPVA